MTPICSPINSPASFCSPLTFQSPPSFQGHFKKFLMESTAHRVEPPSCSLSKPPGISTLYDDSSESLDISVASGSSQNNLCRNSTPIDSDYGSLAAEPIGGTTSKSFLDESLDVSVVDNVVDDSCKAGDVGDGVLTRQRLAMFKECNNNNITVNE